MQDASMRRLLYIVNHIDWFWSHRLPLALAAKESGWDVHLAVAGAGNDHRLNLYGFTGLDLPVSTKGSSLLTAIKVVLAIRTLIKRHKPNLIHAITLKYAFLTGLAVRWCGNENQRVVFTIAGLGYLFSTEGLKPRILRRFTEPLLKFAFKLKHAQVIFQNPDDMETMIARGLIEKTQCHLVIGSGVDIVSFEASPIPQSDSPVVLMLTRLIHDKGITVFIEAAKIVVKEMPKVRFQIAGGTTHNNPLAIEQSEMEKMIATSPVVWLGHVDDMPSLLRQASLIAYPSYYGEGVPKVLLEACASGRPIVTTDHRGCREAVRNGTNGLLVPIKNALMTANAIIELLRDQERLKKMGEAARQRAESEFDVHLVSSATLLIYQKALER